MRLPAWYPVLVVPLVALAAWPAMAGGTWITLTVAGIAMGMMLFLMAAGLSLVFGLMDVLNFAHGGFVTLGAFVAVSVVAWAGDGVGALALGVAAAATACGVFGWGFERAIVRPVYGSHLRQILITTGGLIVATQLMLAAWGAAPLHVGKPALLRGSLDLAGAAVETYRLAALGVGLVLFILLQAVLRRTRVGLLVRAGVENREMVEALGFRVRRLFVGVFVAGAALAGIGGAMWAVYQESVTAAIGAEMTVLVFIVIIIGGLGSLEGCLAGAVLVGLADNYVGFLAPRLALGANIALMVLILLWRPRGLLPLVRG